MNPKESEVLHYMRGRMDSLYTMVENHIDKEEDRENRLQRVEKQLYAIWVLGPLLTAGIGIAYGIKKLL